MSAYPTTLEEARAFLAMRPVERWKVTDRPDGAMERCADLLAEEVERLTVRIRRCHLLLQDAHGTIDPVEHAEWHEQVGREFDDCDEGRGPCSGVVSASEARWREREAADWAASQVVAELSGGEYRAARDARYPEVPDGQD